MIRIIKALNDLKKDIGKTLIVLIAITISIIAAGSVIVSYFILNRETKNSYLLTNPASVIISTNSFSNKIFQELKNLKEIKDIEIRQKIDGRVLTSKDWKPLWLFIIDDFNKQKINIFEKYQGNFQPQKGEILIERMALKFAGKNINDNLLIKLKELPEKNLKINGTVYDMGLAPAWMENMVYGYISKETLDFLSKTDTNNELYIVVSGDRTNKNNIAQKANSIKSFLEKNNIVVNEIKIPKPLTHPHINQMNSLLFILAAFGLLALILSSIITANLIYSILFSQIRQIGIMKSLGGTENQIAGIYLTMILIISTVALIIGLPISLIIGKSYAFFISNQLNIKIINNNLPFIGYLLILIIGFLVSAYPIIKGVKIKVISALREYGIKMDKANSGIIEKILTILFSFNNPLLLSIKNTFRKKLRLILTIFVIALSGTIFITSLFIKTSIIEMVKTNYSYMNYSLNINLIKQYPISYIKEKFNDVKEINGIEFVATSKGLIFNKKNNIFENIKLSGVDPFSDYNKNPILKGKYLSNNDENEIVFTDGFFSENSGYSVGDNIEILVGGKSYKFKIIGKIKDLERTIGYISYKNIMNILSSENLTNEIHIRTTDQSSEFLKNKHNEIENIFKQSNIEITGFMSVRDLEKILTDHMELIISFLLLMSFVILLIGGLGLSITSNINVIERTKEIGILRSIGGTTYSLSFIFIIEGLVIGFISFLISLIVSFPLAIFIGNIFGNIILNTNITFRCNYNSIIIWFFTVTIVGGLINFIPVYNTCQKSVREAIIYE